MAVHNLSKSRYAAERFQRAGAQLRFPGRYFNEFVVAGLGKRPRVPDWKERLVEQEIIGGLELGRFYPELDGDVLLCFTETAAREKMDQLVEIMTE
jgi:glycine dehydrogenase subunit 1